MIARNHFFTNGFRKVWLEKPEFQEAQTDKTEASSRNDTINSARKEVHDLQNARSSISRMQGLTGDEKTGVLLKGEAPSLPGSDLASDNLRLKFEVGRQLNHYHKTYNAKIEPQLIIDVVEPALQQVTRNNAFLAVAGADFVTEDTTQADFPDEINIPITLGGNKTEHFNVQRSALELPLDSSLFDKIEEWLKKTTGYDPERPKSAPVRLESKDAPKQPAENAAPKIKPDIIPPPRPKTPDAAKQSVAETKTGSAIQGSK